ncbi:hypothetical protein BJY16_003931 [Actinoplanes octamycinicus]|uniref:histidine kinase n=1 Tax=Actinoplanes octamycinicus TaxID=135948 RepID=A0A7W7GYC2_9ACTN|nr:histidine kinase dimerization/phospho-acceptor domain-containing protein [Actinoplanes octamycinicus]MBB4740472.1 hypothetical protein [Actinoplanes octamycinicus]
MTTPEAGPPSTGAQLRGRLRRHNRALAELTATKTELVSALLHELRTPLASALAMLGMLPERTGDPLLDEALPAIARNVRRIDEVTAEIATISGIENGTVPLTRARFDLAGLLAETTGAAVIPAVPPASPSASATTPASPAPPSTTAAPRKPFPPRREGRSSVTGSGWARCSRDWSPRCARWAAPARSRPRTPRASGGSPSRCPRSRPPTSSSPPAATPWR